MYNVHDVHVVDNTDSACKVMILQLQTVLQMCFDAPALLLPHPGMLMVCSPAPCGPVVLVDGCDCGLMES